MKSSWSKLTLGAALFFSCAAFSFGQTDREKGIEFFKKADYKSAIDSLNKAVNLNRTDAEGWNILGMAYLYEIKFKESRKALENAVKYDPSKANYLVNFAYVNLISNKPGDADEAIRKALQLNDKNAEAYYVRSAINLWKGKYDQAILDADETIGLDANSSSAYIIKADSYLYKFGQQIYKSQKPGNHLDLLEKSIESLKTCLDNCAKTANLQSLQTKHDEITAFHKYFLRKKDEPVGQITTPVVDPTVTPLAILSKPKAGYTDSARYAAVQGTVMLAVLFSADGKTKTIIVMKPLSNGLTEQAIRAAQGIKFVPQKKDGNPVAVVKQIEYTYTLY